MTAEARPLVVVWAERLGLIAVALGFVREVLIWNERVALDGVPLALLFTIGAPLLVAGLILLVTRRRSLVALVVLVLLTALAWVTAARLGLTDGSPAYTAGALSLLAQTAGLLLFAHPRAWRWLRGTRHG